MSEPLSPAIDSLFAEWTQPGRPGAAVVVLAGGEVVHQGCYGRASLEFDAPIAPDTAFRIASITARLSHQRRRLDLNPAASTASDQLPKW